jgi:small basic protein
MNSSQTLPFDKPQAKRDASPNRARFFYSGAAVLLLALMFFGFQRFYLLGKAYPGRELTPPIRTLIILHGIGMSAWMLLFLVQPLLIVAGNRRVHMLLGRFSAGLAAVIVFLGIHLGIESARVTPPDLRLWALLPKQFMAVPIISIVIFGVLVAIGVWKRRRPEVHRPMMLLAVLAVMTPAMDRIDVIKALYSGTVWGTIFGPFFSTLVVGLFLLGSKWLLTRSFDRWFAMGYAGLVVASALIMQLATTGAWDNFASFLLR